MKVDEHDPPSLELTIKYQFFHAISILVLSLNYDKFNSLLKRSLNMIIIGIFFLFLHILLNTRKNIGKSN